MKCIAATRPVLYAVLLASTLLDCVYEVNSSNQLYVGGFIE